MNDDLPRVTGFKNPPTKHQFSKGKSGNPNGRPKKPVDINVTLKKVLNRKVGVAGSTQKMPIREALIRKLRDLALAGDKRAVALQRQIMEEAPARKPDPVPRVDVEAKARAIAIRLGIPFPGDTTLDEDDE